MMKTCFCIGVILILFRAANAQSIDCAPYSIWAFDLDSNIVHFTLGDTIATVDCLTPFGTGPLAICYDIFNQVDTNLLITFDAYNVVYYSGGSWINTGWSAQAQAAGFRKWLYFLGDHLYFTNNSGPPQIVYPDIHSAVADLAVDSLGRAWVFTGPVSPWWGYPVYADTLRCIDSSGNLVATYPCATPFFTTGGNYGMVLLGDTFWVAKVFEDTLRSYYIQNGIVYQGRSVVLPPLKGADLASCSPGAPGGFLLPQAQLQHGSIKICPDSCIAFTNQSANATSYEWFFQGATPGYSTAANPTNICYLTSGNYNVTLIAHNGPYSDTTTSVNLIQVYAPPSPIIGQSNDTLFANNTTGSDTYQWLFNGTEISGATNPFFIPTQNGNYSVVVTNNQGCSDLDETEFTGVGIQSISANHFFIYPNPADETLIITSSHQSLHRTGFGGVSTLNVYNTLGQIVFTGLVEKELTLDVSQLPPAVYNVVLQSDNIVEVKRLVVQR